MHGLRIRSFNTGVPVVDITDELTRVIGTFNTGVVAGSFTVPADFGKAFFVVMDIFLEDGVRLPEIRIVNNTISWFFDGFQNTWTAVDVLYGVY